MSSGAAKYTAVRKGHPRGGPFVSCLIAAAGAALWVTACGPPPSSTLSPEAAVRTERGAGILRAYRTLGFVAGDHRFAAVGRFVHLPGPGDSTYTVFGLSLPNAALRFRREPPGFLARYHVSVLIGDTLAPAAELAEGQEVRVRTFRETSRRTESVVFQGFLKLRPGEFTARIRVRDLASSSGLTAEVDLRVPRFGPRTLTAPILVYEAEPRSDRRQTPSLILSPRATVEFGSGNPLVYIETDSAGPDDLIIELTEEDQIIWSDTLRLPPAVGRLRSTLTEIDGRVLPPGRLRLRTRFPGQPAPAAETLLVTLEPGWLFTDYREWMSTLRYAGTAAELEQLADARPGERAQRLRAFWRKRDPDPQTAENEFFDRYFRRIQEANNRFGDAATEGWLTDRGAVYVSLGPPDEVFRHLDAQQGPDTHQVWLYNRSLDFEVRLVFVDVTGDGAFGLTAESRRVFYEALERLYS